MNWLKSMVHFLMTPAVLASSSCDLLGKQALQLTYRFLFPNGKKNRLHLLKVIASSILPSSCRMTCFCSASPTPFFFTW